MALTHPSAHRGAAGDAIRARVLLVRPSAWGCAAKRAHPLAGTLKLDRHREADDAAPAVLVHGAYAELHVVLHEVDGRGGDVADVDGVRPHGRSRFPVDDLV